MNSKLTQLESFCKNPNTLVKCIILFGNNEGCIATWQKKCAEAVCGDVGDAFRYTALEMENISKDGQEVYAEYYAQSLMGGRRVVVVKNGDNNLATVVKNMIPETNSENLLIISSSSLSTKSSLIMWAKDRGEDVLAVGCYEDRDEGIGASAASMLRDKGLSIDVSTLQLLCSRLSPDRKINQGEIDKLAMYMGERKNVSSADVLAAVSDVAGANFEDLCYFVAGGEVMKACGMFNRLVKEGEEPTSIIRQIAYHFNKLLSCVAQFEKGLSADEVIKSLRPPLMFYRKDAFKTQLRLWNRERLLGALAMLYDCERDCKTTNLPAEQCASYTIMRLAGAVKKFR